MDSTFKQEYEKDSGALDKVVNSWDKREEHFMGHLGKTGAQTARISDNALGTFIIERSARVMAQLAQGEVKGIGKKHKGEAMLMDMWLHRYNNPQADSQHPLLLKFRLMDQLSMVYGVMFGLTEWQVKDGKIGSDLIVLPPRNCTPQAGRISVNDSDRFFVDMFVSKEKLERELKDKETVWDKDGIKEVLKRKVSSDTKPDKISSQIEKLRMGEAKDDRIRVINRYTRDKITTVAPDYGYIVLKEEDNLIGELPIVEKFDMPLLDTIWGLSTLERGLSVQRAKDSLINLFHEGAKHFVFPPTIINPNGVVPNTLKWGSGNFWMERVPNSIRRLDSNPQGLGMFQGVMGFLNGIQQNQLGTTTTQINAANAANPSFGKTPKALEQQGAREDTRDNQDRFFMEMTVEKTYNQFIKHFLKNGSAAVSIDLLDDEIKDIKKHYKDIENLVEKRGDSHVLNISNKDIKGKEFRFQIKAGSTQAQTQKEQNANLVDLALLFSKMPELEASLAEDGWKLDKGELMSRIAATTGIEDASKILYRMEQADTKKEQEKQQEKAQAEAQAQMPPQMPMQPGMPMQPPMQAPMTPTPDIMAQIQQLTGAQGGQATQRDMNNINQLL